MLLLNHQVPVLYKAFQLITFLSISVFVGLDVADGDLADIEDGLSSGKTLLALHRSLVKHIYH